MSPLARRWTVLIATALGVALTAGLGSWQLQRATQKQALQAALDQRGSQPGLDGRDLATTAQQAQAQHFRRVRLRGRWVGAHTVFLDNRQMNGRPGFFVLTPLQLEGRPEAVLVQRGWVGRDFIDRTRLPVVVTAAEAVELGGWIAPPPARLYEFGGAAEGAIRQNLDVGSFARETGLALLPMSVWQSDAPGAAADGLLRQWARPAGDVHKHQGYAFQWFALAALMTGLYVWFQLVRPRLRHPR